MSKNKNYKKKVIVVSIVVKSNYQMTFSGPILSLDHAIRGNSAIKCHTQTLRSE